MAPEKFGPIPVGIIFLPGVDVIYEARQAAEKPLYQIVSGCLQKFIDSHVDIPNYMVKELTGFLRCGIHEFGFARFQCNNCHEEKTVPFSCKHRGFCPSWGHLTKRKKSYVKEANNLE